MKRSPHTLIRKKHAIQHPLRLVQVDGRRTEGAFIKVPWAMYADDPVWVPPLILERRQHLSSKNPYFAHAQWCCWIAYRGKTPVGRISAQVDELHLQRYQDATGFFGMLEAEDNTETFRELTGAAETWLRGKGMRRILGPFNLSINQECGLLVEGFDTSPAVMMGHARRYYSPRIEEHGYGKEKDLLSYVFDAAVEWPALVKGITSRASQDIRLRSLRRSHFNEELEILRNIFNDAWSRNWGFIPFTREEFTHLGETIKFLVDKEFVQIAEVKGMPAAMIVLLPNINEAIRDLNGRLLPLGWLKLFWRLKVNRPQSARVPLMGVCRKYQESMLGSVMAFMVVDAVRMAGLKRGIREVELSWILEDNKNIRTIIEAIGSKVSKRYRIYSKNLY